MVWGIKASIWFGLCLAALALFLWCLVMMIDTGSVAVGYIWGLIIFGAIAIFAAIVALVAQSGAGGVTRARDALSKAQSAPPRGSYGRDLAGSGFQPSGTGDIPRSSAGRSLK